MFTSDGAFTRVTARHGLIACCAVQPREIELPDEDVAAVGSFLEFLYTGEYFPKKLPGQRVLESDPRLPAVDDSGTQLLKHARLYTLAEKFGMGALKSLASSKIHCVNSTAKGEIVYARYVYANTSPEDQTVRAPIANFWATRSHTLRSEAEAEFKSLCLEYPQFGYEVLSKLLLAGAGRVATSDGDANTGQRGFWTTSSSGSATRRCTPLRIVGASERGKAVEAHSESPSCMYVHQPATSEDLDTPSCILCLTTGSASNAAVATSEGMPRTISRDPILPRTSSNVHRSELGRRSAGAFALNIAYPKSRLWNPANLTALGESPSPIYAAERQDWLCGNAKAMRCAVQ